jgi:hypothetical protein
MTSSGYYIDIAAGELKAHEQTEETWQQKTRGSRWFEAHDHHNLDGPHRSRQ